MSADDLTMGEIARTLGRLDEGQKEVLSQIGLMRGEFVHRTEWEMRNKHVDEGLASGVRNLDLLRNDMASRRTSWPSVAAAIVAIAALALTVVQAMGGA